MSETTFTTSYGTKKIGVFREAGTWGNSTNENWERIEGAIGRTVSINVTAMPIGSVSATSGNSWVAQWITVNAADSDEPGSEGRCRVVEFTGTVAANATVNIRGSNSSVIPARVMFVKNSLSGTNSLILDADGVDYTIPSGGSALVAVVPTTAGGYARGVHGLIDLNSIEIAAGRKIDFLGAGEIDFSGVGTIRIPFGGSNPLTITDGVRNWVILDGSFGGGRVDVNASLIDVATQDTTVLVRDSQALALSVTDGTTTFLTIDSSANEINFLTTMDIRTGSITSANQATTWTLRDNDAASINFVEGGTSYLKAVTTNGAERTTSDVLVQAPDLLVTGTDGYVNFNTTTGASGIGVRNNAGVMELKHTSGNWARLAKGVILAAASNATAVGTGQNKQGAFDIGPVRVIFNTVQMSGGDLSVTLGNGTTGTSTTMGSALWTVMACQMDDTSAQNGNVASMVTNSAGGVFSLDCGGPSQLVTYIAIGDSAA